MIRQLVADGTTVLLTTQYLEEADQLAHDIAVIDHGAVIATGTPDELKASAGRQVLEVTPASRADVRAVAALLSALLNGATPAVSPESGQVSVQVDGGRQLPEIIRALDDRGIELAEFALRRASLDEVFLALTGHRAEEDTQPRRREKREQAARPQELTGAPDDHGHASAPAPAPPCAPASPATAAARTRFTLAWRRVLKIQTNPEDLFGLWLQPIMYLVLFTYVFGGAIAGSTHQYLQYSLPGILVLSVSSPRSAPA